MQALGFRGNSFSDATFAIIISSRGPIEYTFASLKIRVSIQVLILGFLSWELLQTLIKFTVGSIINLALALCRSWYVNQRLLYLVASTYLQP